VPKAHQVQHRKKERDISGRELALLKKENNQLRRKISKLQKQLQKAIEGLFILDDGINDSPVNVPSLGAPAKEALPGCPKCGSMNMGVLKSPNGTVTVCKACLHKRFDERAA